MYLFYEGIGGTSIGFEHIFIRALCLGDALLSAHGIQPGVRATRLARGQEPETRCHFLLFSAALYSTLIPTFSTQILLPGDVGKSTPSAKEDTNECGTLRFAMG
jgi:hypothetical protein